MGTPQKGNSRTCSSIIHSAPRLARAPRAACCGDVAEQRTCTRTKTTHHSTRFKCMIFHIHTDASTQMPLLCRTLATACLSIQPPPPPQMHRSCIIATHRRKPSSVAAGRHRPSLAFGSPGPPPSRRRQLCLGSPDPMVARKVVDCRPKARHSVEKNSVGHWTSCDRQQDQVRRGTLPYLGPPASS